jgi:hypothetical protein
MEAVACSPGAYACPFFWRPLKLTGWEPADTIIARDLLSAVTMCRSGLGFWPSAVSRPCWDREWDWALLVASTVPQRSGEKKGQRSEQWVASSSPPLCVASAPAQRTWWITHLPVLPLATFKCNPSGVAAAQWGTRPGGCESRSSGSCLMSSVGTKVAQQRTGGLGGVSPLPSGLEAPHFCSHDWKIPGPIPFTFLCRCSSGLRGRWCPRWTWPCSIGPIMKT